MKIYLVHIDINTQFQNQGVLKTTLKSPLPMTIKYSVTE